MGRICNLSGKRNGRLIAIEPVGIKPNGSVLWKCVCDCGNFHLVGADVFKPDRCTSCGCARHDAALRMSKGNVTHGHAADKHPSPEYTAWKSMRRRCSNPTGKARTYVGISVCDRWKKFDNFLEDMGCKPTKRHTLERRRNSEGYNPENCRWALPTEQARNRSTNRFITRNGRTMIVTDWANEVGLPEVTVRNRLFRGWSEERALTTPLLTQFRNRAPST